MEWFTLLLLVTVVVLCFRLLFLQNNPNAPPCIRGWIPWVGAAFEFGKEPLHFIARARAKYGPVFTVLVAGKRLTFVTLHEDFRTFFMSKDVDFEQAVQEPVRNTASISKESFFKFHPACNTMIKGRLTPGNTALLVDHLCEEFNNHLELLGRKGSGSLNKLVREWASAKEWLLSLLENMIVRAVDNHSNESGGEVSTQSYDLFFVGDTTILEPNKNS
uniref:Cytochrome P450, family 39, subfamily A, polypeptide 1 n=1 Tax=Astyanax mexicanus TaxID=7994 RepID=A0A8B9HW65_ASTMX